MTQTKGHAVHSYNAQYHLHVLQAFGAAQQQLVVGPQPLPIKLPQQDHLWHNQKTGSGFNDYEYAHMVERGEHYVAP